MAQDDYRDQIQTLSDSADSIPNYNIWTRLAKAGVKGYSAYLSSRQKQLQFNAQESNARYRANIARLNANFAKQQSELDAQNAIDNMYGIYRMGEHQAMLQGQADAQQIHGAQAQTASSGVRMNQGSKAEIDTSNRMAAQINQNTIQENIIREASKMKTQERSAIARGVLEQANYMAQAYIAEGDAKAASIMAKSINPLGQGLLAFQNSMIQSYGGNMSAMGSDFSNMFSFGGK